MPRRPRPLIALTALALAGGAAPGAAAASDAPAPPSTIAVDNPGDVHDLDPGDGVCLDTAGYCSLRAAVQEANALPGEQTLVLVPRTFWIGLAGRDEDAAATGDLDVTDALVVQGQGAVVDASNVDRALDVRPGGSLRLEGVTLRRGQAGDQDGGLVRADGPLEMRDVTLFRGRTDGDGGAVASTAGLVVDDVRVERVRAERGGAFAISEGPATLTGVVVDDAVAHGAGGVLHVDGSLELQGLTATNSSALEGGVLAVVGGRTRVADADLTGPRATVDGGAVLLVDGELFLNSSRVHGAAAGGDGGGVAVRGGRASLNRTRVENSRAEGSGGAVSATGRGTVSVLRGRLAGNSAVLDGGGLSAEGRAWVQGTRVRNNEAGRRGGGLEVDGGRLDVRRSTVDINSAVEGAGVAARDSWLRVEAVRLAGNEGFVGAGLHLSGDGSSTVLSSSLVDQRAQHVGGGVHADGRGPVSVTGTTFENNLTDDWFLDPGAAQPFLVDGVAVEPAAPPVGDTAVSERAGAGRSLGDGDWLGANGANLRSNRHLWASPEFAEALADLGPASVRMPGGSTSQFWDFATGLFVGTPGIPDEYSPDDEGEGEVDPTPFTLEQMAELSSTSGTSTTWVLNMTTSTLDAQVDALEQAVGLGMDVERVALGNEMWTDEATVLDAYPEPEDYAAVVPEWTAAVRDAVPGVQVSAVGYCKDDAPGMPRKHTWDERVLPLVAEHVDAVSCHPYFSISAGTTEPLDTETEVLDVVAQERHAAGLVRTRIDEFVPEKLDVWANEWGLLRSDAPVIGTHLHGLLVADYGLGLLEVERVRHADLHALLGGIYASVYAYPSVLDAETTQPGVVDVDGPVPVLGRSAVGESARLLFRATGGATSTVPLDLVGGPDARAVQARGARFDGPGSSRALLVNPTAEPLVVDTAAGALAGTTGGETVASTPHEAALADSGPRPRPLVVAEDGALTLPAYSVTLVEL